MCAKGNTEAVKNINWFFDLKTTIKRLNKITITHPKTNEKKACFDFDNLAREGGMAI
jgi:hypothetical protein